MHIPKLIIKQIGIGVVTFAVFVGVVAYMFGHTVQTIAEAQITSVLMARGLDTGGNPVGVSQKFDPKSDRSVYAFVELKNATKKTQVAYIRYYNGRYIDSKITVPSKDDVPAVFFNFEKGVGAYPVGNYSLVTYINGKRAVQTDYAYVSPALAQATTATHIAPAKNNAYVAAVASIVGASANSAPVSGKVIFVIAGTVSTSTVKSINIHVTNTSKNITSLKHTDQTLPLTKHTRITKNGKAFPLRTLSNGSKVFVYGIYDKKSSKYLDVQWIRIQ